jgi:hypothetical protein
MGIGAKSPAHLPLQVRFLNQKQERLHGPDQAGLAKLVAFLFVSRRMAGTAIVWRLLAGIPIYKFF